LNAQYRLQGALMTIVKAGLIAGLRRARIIFRGPAGLNAQYYLQGALMAIGKSGVIA
jgi:hypothetical protein